MQVSYRYHLGMALFLVLSGQLQISCGSGDEDDTAVEDAIYQPPPPEPIANAAPLPPPSTLVCPKSTTLTYENFGQAFLLNYCTMCHSSNLPETLRGGAPANVNLDSPEKIQLWISNILRAVGGSAPASTTTDDTPTDDENESSEANAPLMPPSQNVPAAELSLFKEWLNCGAPGGEPRLTP